MNPRKKRRIEELLRREISSIVLYEMNDPRVGPVALTRVDLAEDQRSARVFVIVRGTDEAAEESLRVLSGAHGFVQALIARRLDLRYTPVLRFEMDRDVLQAMRTEQLIKEARRQDQEPPAPV
ncbi:MAG: 30S ribosome-binding factor RbfA [Candidatus Brocadiaceae bacterium]|nr:30S ribosome-binding factor RbfA [Candidatus Brocadiaceae bacterium]